MNVTESPTGQGATQKVASCGGKRIDPETGIWFMSDWGQACYRGFVSDARFDKSATVIKRTNRETTRKWRRSDG